MENDPAQLNGMTQASALLKRVTAVMDEAVLRGVATVHDDSFESFGLQDGDLEIHCVGEASGSTTSSYEIFYMLEEGRFTTGYSLVFPSALDPLVAVSMSQYVGDRLGADDVYLSGEEAHAVIGLVSEELERRYGD